MTKQEPSEAARLDSLAAHRGIPTPLRFPPLAMNERRRVSLKEAREVALEVLRVAEQRRMLFAVHGYPDELPKPKKRKKKKK